MEENYNILWIDDEHESLSGTKGRAKRNGLTLIGFKSLNAGMEELEKNYYKYDGVIFDAKFYESEDDVSGSEDTEYVFRAKERLCRIPKFFKEFVLTGQAEAYDDSTFKKGFKNIYQKGNDTDIEKLFKDIKAAASEQEDYQIRHDNKKAFDCCADEYVGGLSGKNLLHLLKERHSTHANANFNVIRKIVEDLFRAFYMHKLIPLEFVSPEVALNASSKFLAGRSGKGEYFIEKGYKHLDETHIHPLVASNLRNILAIVQPGSHSTDLDSHLEELDSAHLFNSVLEQLLYVLSWFKGYIDTHPKQENWEYVG